MTKYLNTRPGSIEEVISNMTKDLRQDSAYQDMFKKELEKAGKGIGAMTPAENKAFFNKIDTKYKTKDEQATKGDIDKFHKKLDNLVHKSFGHSSDEKKMKNEEEEYSSQQIKMAYGIANDKRYKGGNYSGAAKAIEKIAKGLSQHPDVLKALKKANEDLEEGKMSQIDQMKKDGKSAEDIAKLMKLDVKTVKGILGEMASGKAYAIGMATAKKKYDDEPPLEKKTITKGHEIAKKLMKKETHTYTTMKMNQNQKDADGEKEPQKIKENTFAEVVKNMWQKSAEEIEEVKEKSKYLKAKTDVSKTMVDTVKTKIDTKPEVSFDK